MPSNMKPEYASVPKGAAISRSMFQVGENHKTTFNGGQLVPIYWDYFYPGEVLKGKVQAFLRMSSPLETPMMDNMKLTIHWYSCPLRIIWDNFRKFFGERVDPGDSIDYSVPTLTTTNIDTSVETNFTRLATSLGIPFRTAAQGGVDFSEVSALPFRAYNKIYNWHYRDQQQQNSVDERTGDGPDSEADYNIKLRGKRHDYFTANLLAPQRGDAITIGGEVATAAITGGNPTVWSDANSDFHELDAGAAQVDISATTGAEADVLYPNTTILELRNAAAIQQFLEKDNRYGTRFDEVIYSHYGAEFNDVRIAPVFLGGGSGYIQTSPIPNQSGTGNLGDLAAIATGALDGAAFTYALDEPSIVMCIANVSADLSYQQGMPRKFKKSTRYDFFSPEFVDIGDQATLTEELYYQNTATDDTVFGYNPRFEEMRTGYNKISGEFNSDHPTSLDTWHLGLDFASAPVLGNTWIVDNSPYNRIQQVASAADFLADFQIDLQAARNLPVHGTPGITRL